MSASFFLLVLLTTSICLSILSIYLSQPPHQHHHQCPSTAHHHHHEHHVFSLPQGLTDAGLVHLKDLVSCARRRRRHRCRRCRHLRRRRPPPSLLLRCGDVHPNPGPRGKKEDTESAETLVRDSNGNGNIQLRLKLTDESVHNAHKTSSEKAKRYSFRRNQPPEKCVRSTHLAPTIQLTSASPAEQLSQIEEQVADIRRRGLTDCSCYNF